MNKIILQVFLVLFAFQIYAQDLKTLSISGGNIPAEGFVIHPLNPNLKYSAAGSMIYKSYRDTISDIILSPYGVNHLYLADKDTNILYLTDYTGLYRSNNQGKDLNKIWDGWSILDVNKQNSDVVYTTRNGNELWISRNNGIDWSKLYTFTNSISALKQVEADTSIIYAALENKILKSTNSGFVWSYFNEIPLSITISKIGINPLNKNSLYIEGGNRLYKTENNNPPFEILQLGNFDVLFDFFVSALDTNLILCSTNIGLFKTTNQGLTWLEFNNWNVLYRSVNTVKADPNQLNILYCSVNGLGILKSTDYGNSWEQTYNSLGSISDIEFYKDNLNKITVLSSGMLNSFDNGLTWERDSSLDNINYQFVAFNPNNSKTGFLFSDHNYPIRTTDGGVNWNVMDSLYDAFFSFHPTNEKLIYAYAVGDVGLGPDYFYRSMDNGNTWQELHSDAYINLQFSKSNDSLVFGYKYSQSGEKTLLLSRNYGSTFDYTLFNNYRFHTYKVDVNNHNIIYASLIVNNKERLVLSTDMGTSWDYIDEELLLYTNNNYSVNFIWADDTKNGRIYVVTNSDLFLTENFGGNWRKVISGFVGAISSDYNNPRRLFLNTRTGWKYFTDTLTVTRMENIDNGKMVESYSLYQNYPNPFNPSTKIKYSIPKFGLVSIRVYDILGKEISQLVNEVKQPGRYEVDFDGSSLSSGIFFYQIQAGKFLQTKKMVLMK